MADTHINAFFADVDEAEKVVQESQAKLETAKAALETKKKEVGFIDAAETSKTPAEEPKQPKKPLPNLDSSEGYKKAGWKK